MPLKGLKRHRFTVRMTGFRPPFDMLRYDQCWPATEPEAGKLERMADGDGGEVLVTFETDSPHAPTVGRWKSFTCEVLPHDPRRDGDPSF